MTPEGRVKAGIKKWLAANRVIPASDAPRHFDARTIVNVEFDGWYFMPVASMYSVKGIPDFVGIWFGVPFTIEAKAPGGETTDNQEQQLGCIQQAGGITLVCSDVRQLDDMRGRVMQRRAKELT